MSFENKGFPNDLDSRFSEMNKQFTRYNEPQTAVNSAGNLIKISSGSGSGPIGAVLPQIELPGLKYKKYYENAVGDIVIPQSVQTGYSQTISQTSGAIKKDKENAITKIEDFFSGLFKSEKEKIKGAIKRRKQRRYKRKGSKIVKVNTDGTETEVINPAERLQAVQEINTPTERLPESAIVNAQLPDINQPDFIKTDLPEVTISATKKSNSMKYVAIGILAVILVVIAYKLIKKK
jgi:hypothetical protein